MNLYERQSYRIVEIFTKAYSTSFSLSSLLFNKRLRPHIYAIYGMVRAADEIVDTYAGAAAGSLLDTFETDVMQSLDSGYSANPLVQAFSLTARRYHINKALIQPFFESMRTDLQSQTYDEPSLQRYIYGSAEVIGLMCLKVFVDSDDRQYKTLQAGARRLGSAYQKINFLRDIHADHKLGRWYFPISSYDAFDSAAQKAIVADIKADLQFADQYIAQLPLGCRAAVRSSYQIYSALLKNLERADVHTLKSSRLSTSSAAKRVFWKNLLTGRLG